jgi:hypothetical protein
VVLQLTALQMLQSQMVHSAQGAAQFEHMPGIRMLCDSCVHNCMPYMWLLYSHILQCCNAYSCMSTAVATHGGWLEKATPSPDCNAPEQLHWQ